MPQHGHGKKCFPHALSAYIDDESAVNSLGSMKISKGYFAADTLFYAWDAVDNCLGENCIVTEQCPYKQPVYNKETGKFETKKCQVQRNFLKAVSVMLYRNFYETISESQLFRVGLHLMPLYKMLSKLYMEELAVDHAIYTDGKGLIRAHPVFKEIRETIKAITQEWNNLGLAGMADIPDSSEGFHERGDPDYYENLNKGYEESARKSKLVNRRAE